MKRFPVAALVLAGVVSIAAAPVTARADEEIFVGKPPSGIGLVITGSILTGVGVLNLAAGPPLCIALTPSSSFDSTGERSGCITAELVVGGILTVIGVPMLIVGANRYSRFKQWKEDHHYGFTLAPMRHGGAVGLGWTF